MTYRTPLYVPSLRLKSGELSGLSTLHARVADYVLPRLIVPPPRDRDTEVQRELFKSDLYPRIDGLVDRYWRSRPVLIQLRYLIEELGHDRLEIWLPALFDHARGACVEAVPLFSLGELASYPATVWRTVNELHDLKLAILIDYADFVDPNLGGRVRSALDRLRLTAGDCAVLVDFAGADFGSPGFVAPIIEGALLGLQEMGRWRAVAFQGTNFPEKNPADPGEAKLVPRNEWIAWRAAVDFDPTTAEHLIFGDYGPESAKLNFSGSRGRAHRHLRYTAGENWFVVRGADTGRHAPVMREVCKRIVGHGSYLGRAFSHGDDQIFRIAEGLLDAGTPALWRSINVNHHITHVVRDIGRVRSIAFEEIPVQEFAEQALLNWSS